MKNQISVIAMAMVMAFTMASCGASKTTVAPVTPQPQPQPPTQSYYVPEVAVTFPCSDLDSNEEFLRVNALGTSKDRTLARQKAYTNALAGLSTKLAGVASSMQLTVGVSTTVAGEEAYHDKFVNVAKVVAQEFVNGYRTACEEFRMNTQTGAYTCYVTIEFGKQAVVKSFYNKLNQQQLIRADYDFDRYMQVFEKELDEYEKSR